MNAYNTQTEIDRFIKSYIASRNGTIIEESNVLVVKYPDEPGIKRYTYDSTVAREKNALLITRGTPVFQQIVKQCLESGITCQVSIRPRENLEMLVREYFKDSPFACEHCIKINNEEDTCICPKPQTCYHKIDNGRIESIRQVKREPLRYFLFVYNISFQNRLKSKDEEMVAILLDEEANVVATEISPEKLLEIQAIEIKDFKGRIPSSVFDKIKATADARLFSSVKDKLILFDLQLVEEKKSKLKNYERRLKRERREQVISRKHNFDPLQWQANYEAAMKREEESLVTNIAIKLSNLLVINTAKVNFEITLDNNATIHSHLVLGINHSVEVTCPICREAFIEGYATQDSLYVCKDCTRQSIETSKVYSKKATLKLDEALDEYIEPNCGFVCSVCGKRYSQLLEFKCSHDNSSVCIHHYGVCDICKKPFSKLNLSYTQEFKRQLCSKHTAKCAKCQSIIGVDECMLSKFNGETLCKNCFNTVEAQ